MRQECEKIPESRWRDREICSGEAGLPLYKVNDYRLRWGLEPLLELSNPVRNVVDRIASRHSSTKVAVKPEGCKGCSKKRQQVKSKPKASGPGTELSNLLSEFGIKPRTGCSCNLLIDTMNSLGPNGCRANKEKLLKLMRKNQDKYGWGTYLRAGFNAVRTGWVFKLNPIDPLPQLFDEAVRRAEQIR